MLQVTTPAMQAMTTKKDVVTRCSVKASVGRRKRSLESSGAKWNSLSSETDGRLAQADGIPVR